MKEEALDKTQGSRLFAYNFIKYSTDDKKLYLGLDCQPLLGSSTDPSKHNARFMYDQELSRKQVLQIRKELIEETKTYKVGPACVRKPKDLKSEKEERRKKRLKIRQKAKKERKYRQRLCRKFSRRISNIVTQIRICERKFNCRSNSNIQGNKKGSCVCNLLQIFLSRPRVAKTECLVDHITRWVERLKDGPPNEHYIRLLADTLYPRYKLIFKNKRKTRVNVGKGEDNDKKTTKKPSKSRGKADRRRGKDRRKGRNGKKRRKNKTKKFNFKALMTRQKTHLVLTDKDSSSSTRNPWKNKRSLSSSSSSNSASLTSSSLSQSSPVSSVSSLLSPTSSYSSPSSSFSLSLSISSSSSSSSLSSPPSLSRGTSSKSPSPLPQNQTKRGRKSSRTRTKRRRRKHKSRHQLKSR